MKLIKCDYCGDYFDEEEAIGWDVCSSCALKEEDEHRWYEDEREDYVLYDLDTDDLNERGISVKLAQWEGDEDGAIRYCDRS